MEMMIIAMTSELTRSYWTHCRSPLVLVHGPEKPEFVLLLILLIPSLWEFFLFDNYTYIYSYDFILSPKCLDSIEYLQIAWKTDSQRTKRFYVKNCHRSLQHPLTWKYAWTLSYTEEQKCTLWAQVRSEFVPSQPPKMCLMKNEEILGGLDYLARFIMLGRHYCNCLD